MSWFQQPTMTITSPDFEHEGDIPARFTCDGEGGTPTLTVQGIPNSAKSIAIIVEDPDVPTTTFSHWIVWNIEPTSTIPENSAPGIAGSNSLGKTSYSSPCPTAGTHRYFFKVFALDQMLDLDPESNKYKLEKAMEGHIVATGEIIGMYRKR